MSTEDDKNEAGDEIDISDKEVEEGEPFPAS
jgi:hypothetical protein